jgi:NAD(P)H dehydrogenase (quinone)
VAAVAQHVAGIDAARDAGAKRILCTSHQGAAEESVFAPMHDHAAPERYPSPELSSLLDMAAR